MEYDLFSFFVRTLSHGVFAALTTHTHFMTSPLTAVPEYKPLLGAGIAFQSTHHFVLPQVCNCFEVCSHGVDLPHHRTQLLQEYADLYLLENEPLHVARHR